MSDLNINPIDSMNWRSWSDAFADAANVKPKDVNPLSWRMMFYQNYLWRLFLGSVDVSVPDHWSIDYVRRTLFLGGAFAVTKWQGVLIPAAYTVDTRNAWKAPITIRNLDEVAFGTKTIGEDAEIIYLNDSYMGTSYASIAELVDVFASKLANADGAIDVNLLNSRAAFVFQADDQSEATGLKALFTKIMNGEPAVFWRKRKRAAVTKDDALPITTMPVKQNYVADLIQDSKRDIVNEFLTMIGVSNNNTEKKERLVVDEVNANNEETSYSVALWQANIDRQLKKARDLFQGELDGLKIKFKATIKDYYYTGKGGAINESVGKSARSN